MKYKVVRTYLNDYGSIDLQLAFEEGWQYKTAHVLTSNSNLGFASVIEYVLYKKEK